MSVAIMAGQAVDALRACSAHSASLVYIDPPYGTGRQFAHYRDTDRPGTDAWQTMMRQMIGGAKHALKPTGTLWLHVDPQAARMLYPIADAVFGAHNYLGTIAWQRSVSTRSGRTGLSQTCDHIIVYRASRSAVLNLPQREHVPPTYRNPDGDTRPWRRNSLNAPEVRPGGSYGIENPMTGEVHHPPEGGHWRWNRERALAALSDWPVDYVIDADGDLRTSHPQAAQRASDLHAAGPWPLLFFGTNGTGKPQHKIYLGSDAATSTWWPASEVGTASDGLRESRTQCGQPFSTVKPMRLVQRIIDVASSPGDRVIDVCAGSAPLGALADAMGRHSVIIERNAETIRSFIMPRLRYGVDHGYSIDGMSAPTDPALSRLTGREVEAADRVLAKLDPKSPLRARLATQTATAHWRGSGKVSVFSVASPHADEPVAG